MTAEPIRASVMVSAPLDHAFDSFVTTIASWWPVRPYSLGQNSVVDVTLPPEVGAVVYESHSDGTQVPWGRVTSWDPPHGFGMSWEVLPVTTQVEVRFTSVGERITRVSVEHAGWERLTVEQLAAATSAAGGYARGWQLILTAYADHVEGAATV